MKEELVEVSWEICKKESWQKVNMRLVPQKAGVSTTAFYGHLKNKDALKAELIQKGFKILLDGVEDVENKFPSYGVHYIRFGLDYPHNESMSILLILIALGREGTTRIPTSSYGNTFLKKLTLRRRVVLKSSKASSGSIIDPEKAWNFKPQTKFSMPQKHNHNMYTS